MHLGCDLLLQTRRLAEAAGYDTTGDDQEDDDAAYNRPYLPLRETLLRQRCATEGEVEKHCKGYTQGEVRRTEWVIGYTESEVRLQNE